MSLSTLADALRYGHMSRCLKIHNMSLSSFLRLPLAHK